MRRQAWLRRACEHDRTWRPAARSRFRLQVAGTSDLHNRVGNCLDLAFMRDDLELHLFGQPISGKEIRLFAESLDLDDGQSTHADAHQLALYGVQSVGANDCNHVTRSTVVSSIVWRSSGLFRHALASRSRP